MFILYNQERDINQDLYLPDIPSGYLTVRHGKWPIEIDGLPNLKMVIFHGELLNNQMVTMIFLYEHIILYL